MSLARVMAVVVALAQPARAQNQVVSAVFTHLQRYPDRGALVPGRLIEGLLDGLGNAPGVAIGRNSMGATVYARGSHRTFPLGGAQSLPALSELAQQMIGFAVAVSPVEHHQTIVYRALNGMFASFDRFSTLVTPADYRKMTEATRGGGFGGVGVMLAKREGRMRILRPVPTLDGAPTPAIAAGLEPGCDLLRIDDQPLGDLDLEGVSRRIRGQPGSQVILEVQCPGSAAPRRVAVTRQVIRAASVTARRVDSEVGYLRIDSFTQSTAEEVSRNLTSIMRGRPTPLGVVLDLRQCPGGLLEQAVMTADLFVSSGALVTTVGASRDERVANPGGAFENLPIVVLVDGATSSGAEIVAGALVQRGRAVLIGDTTYGKGSVQVLHPLADGGALKLTVATQLAGGALDVSGAGLAPDVRMVNESAEPPAQPPPRWRQAVGHTRAELRYRPPTDVSAADAPMELARDLIRAVAPHADRSTALARLTALMEARQPRPVAVTASPPPVEPPRAAPPVIEHADDAEAALARGEEYLKQADYPAAIAHFTTARALAPNRPGPYLALGIAYARAGRCAEALDSLDEYARRKTKDPRPIAATLRDECRKKLGR